VEVGARSVTVCHLGNLAYWHRQTLDWDPLAWQFKNNMGTYRKTAPVPGGQFITDDRPIPLDRERRDPWKVPAI
jgi:hypothetical protein